MGNKSRSLPVLQDSMIFGGRQPAQHNKDWARGSVHVLANHFVLSLYMTIRLAKMNGCFFVKSYSMFSLQNTKFSLYTVINWDNMLITRECFSFFFRCSFANPVRCLFEPSILFSFLFVRIHFYHGKVNGRRVLHGKGDRALSQKTYAVLFFVSFSSSLLFHL